MPHNWKKMFAYKRKHKEQMFPNPGSQSFTIHRGKTFSVYCGYYIRKMEARYIYCSFYQCMHGPDQTVVLYFIIWTFKSWMGEFSNWNKPSMLGSNVQLNAVFSKRTNIMQFQITAYNCKQFEKKERVGVGFSFFFVFIPSDLWKR